MIIETGPDQANLLKPNEIISKKAFHISLNPPSHGQKSDFKDKFIVENLILPKNNPGIRRAELRDDALIRPTTSRWRFYKKTDRKKSGPKTHCFRAACYLLILGTDLTA